MSDDLKPSAPLPPDVLKQPIKAVKRARKLRKEMSLPEVLLWVQLQKRPGGFKFRKQVPADPYTLDYACLSARLVIEVDGEAHGRGDQPRRDGARDRVMTERGFRTLRLPAYEVLKNMDGCIAMIVEWCASANPPRNGEGDHEVVEGSPLSSESGAGRREGTPPSASLPPPRSGEDRE